MQSLSFPVMFRNTKTLVLNDRDATLSNLKLLLRSSKKGLFGDPFFGTNLMELFYAQNNIALRDLVVDEIYTAIVQFMPQMKLKREDITLTQNKTELIVNIKASNSNDISTNMYSIPLMTGQNTQEDIV